MANQFGRSKQSIKTLVLVKAENEWDKQGYLPPPAHFSSECPVRLVKMTIGSLRPR
jgi:hypothetical protein